MSATAVESAALTKLRHDRNAIDDVLKQAQKNFDQLPASTSTEDKAAAIVALEAIRARRKTADDLVQAEKARIVAENEKAEKERQ